MTTTFIDCTNCGASYAPVVVRQSMLYEEFDPITVRYEPGHGLWSATIGVEPTMENTGSEMEYGLMCPGCREWVCGVQVEVDAPDEGT